MKKLNFFIPNFHPGGAEKVCITLANELSLRYSITIYTNENAGSLKSEIYSEVKVKTLRHKKAFANILAIRRILKCNTGSYNVVFLTHQILAVLIAATGLRTKRMIVSERNDLKRDLIGLPLLKRYLFSKLIWLFYRRADKIICVSEGVLQSVAELSGYTNNLVTVYNPVLGPLTEKLSKQKLPDHIEKLVINKKVLLNVGRLEVQKNHKLLISTFAKFQKKVDDSVLLIAGEGSERKELEQQILKAGLSKSVYLIGHIKNPYPLYVRADCFVLSSDFEGLPGVLIQALAYCKHIISTDCESGPREILKNGKLGHLIRTKDEDGLLSALCNVFNHEIQYVNFIERDLGRFNVLENVKKYEEIIIQ